MTLLDRRILMTPITFAVSMAMSSPVVGEDPPAGSGSPSASLMTNTAATIETDGEAGEGHELRRLSMFAVTPPEPRTFQKHDLVQIIVRETSRAESKHELDTDKKYNLDGSIDSFPSLQLSDILQLQLRASDPENFPIDVGVDFEKKFEGEGDYKREDDLTARLTAEVLEIQPNGNLVLEARTHIRNDKETMTIKVTGICRSDDVSPANTILSNQIHDLSVEKVHEGELKNANEKGIIAQVLDAIFAF